MFLSFHISLLAANFRVFTIDLYSAASFFFDFHEIIEVHSFCVKSFLCLFFPQILGISQFSFYNKISIVQTILSEDMLLL